MKKKHVNTIPPTIVVDEDGNFSWEPKHLDYDATQYNEGKVVTHKEFNTLFLQQLYQGNYITDNLTEFFANLGTAIRNKVSSEFELRNSFVKVFTQNDWQKVDDEYSELVITPAEHGYAVDKQEGTPAQKMNIDVEMYAYNATSQQFFNVSQFTIMADNTVTLYTDDALLNGFVIIRPNDKAYRILAESVQGLAKVATSGDYMDLSNRPNLSQIDTNKQEIAKIINGETAVKKAETAQSIEHVDLTSTSRIMGIPVREVFIPETGAVYKAESYTSRGAIAKQFMKCFPKPLLLKDFAQSVQTWTDKEALLQEGHAYRFDCDNGPGPWLPPLHSETRSITLVYNHPSAVYAWMVSPNAGGPIGAPLRLNYTLSEYAISPDVEASSINYRFFESGITFHLEAYVPQDPDSGTESLPSDFSHMRIKDISDKGTGISYVRRIWDLGPITV